MAETPPKRTAKPPRDEPSVLGRLPASRPERLGRPRPEAAKKRPAGVNGAHGPTVPGRVSRARQAQPDTPGAPAKRARAKRAAGERPKAVRPASPPLRAARASEPPPSKPLAAPSGTELVTTTIRAAGELAQIGFTVGGQLLKRTIDRLPRL